MRAVGAEAPRVREGYVAAGAAQVLAHAREVLARPARGPCCPAHQGGRRSGCRAEARAMVEAHDMRWRR